MINFLEYGGIILWVCYLFLLIKREVCRKNKYIKEYNKKLIFKHPFHIIRIDTLFFLVVFLIYQNFADNRVLPYLYLIIILTNIVYVIYDLSDNYNDVKKSFKDEWLNYFLGVIIVLFILIYGYICENLLQTCTLTLALNLIVPIYVWLIQILLKR